MLKIYRCFYFILLILLSPSAFAQNADNINVRDGFYFGTALGSGATFIGFAHDTYGPVALHGNAYQFNVGYAWQKSSRTMLGIEADYNDFAKATESGMGINWRVQYLIPWTTVATTTRTDSSSTARSYSIFGTANTYPFQRLPNLYVLGKMGLGLMTQHFVQTGTRTEVWNPGDTTVTPIAIDQTGNNLTLLTDFGLGYSFTPHIALTLELQNSWGSFNYLSKVFSFDWAAVDRTGLPTYAFLAGLNFRF